MKSKIKFLFIASLTLFSFFIYPGYQVFTDDHSIYIPQILHSQNPQVFKNSLITQFNQIKFTVFDEIILILIDIFKIDIFKIFLSLSLLIRFLYYLLIFEISFFISSRFLIALIITLFLTGGYDIYGTSTSTLDTVFVPRFTSLAFNLYFLSLFFKKKYCLSVLALIIGLLLHPISSVPFWLFFILAVVFKPNKITIKNIAKLLALSLILNIFIVIAFPLTKIDPVWESIIRSRTPYVFLTSWDINFILIFFADLIVISLSFWKGKFSSETKHSLSLIYLTSFFLFLVYLVNVEIFKLHFAAQLQLLRGLLLIKIFSVMIFSSYALKSILNNKISKLLIFSLIGLFFSFIFKDSFIYPFPVKNSLIYLFLPFFLVAIFMNYLKTKAHQILPSALCLLIPLSFSLLLSKYFIIRLSNYISLITTVFTTAYLFNYFKNKWKMNLLKFRVKEKISYFFISVAIIIFSMTNLSKFNLVPRFFKEKPFMEICAWIKNNSLNSDVFLADTTSFISDQLRQICQVNLFVHREDGAQVVFNRNYALEWKKRMELANNFFINPKQNADFIRKYHLKYLFSEKEIITTYPLVFSNNKYYLYRLN